MGISKETGRFVKKMFIAGSIIFLFVLLTFMALNLSSFFLIVFTGVLFAVFLEGIAEWGYQKTGLDKRYGVIITVLLLLVIVAGFFILFGPNVIEQFGELGEKLPKAWSQIKSELKKVEWLNGLISNIPPPQKIISSKNMNVMGEITGIFSSLAAIVTNISIILVIGIYLAFSAGFYVTNFIRLLPKERREDGRDLAESIVITLRRWLIGRLSSMLAVGVLTAIGLWIIDLPLILSLSVIATLFAFIPYIGPVLSILPAIIIAFSISPTEVVYVILVYISVQFLEGNFITPLIQLKAVSIPPVILISMQILMGILFGFMGLLLSTPVTVVLLVLIQKLYMERVLHSDEKFFIDIV